MVHPPVFIVGCGRSGTTLLRSALNAHSRISVPLESLFIVDYLRAAEHRPLPSLIRACLQEYELKEWGIDLQKISLEGLATLPDFLERLHLAYGGFRKDIWAQKTPRFIRHLELIDHFFPDARYIHLIRDPRAVAASLIRSPVHASTARHAALRWRDDVAAGLAFESRYPSRVLRVHYEDLVRCFGDTLKGICGFIGVAFETAMLDHQRYRDHQYLEPYYREVHRNLEETITRDRVTAWTNELTPEEIATVEAICGASMEPLGYPLTAQGVPVQARWRTALERIGGLARQTMHYLRHRRGYLLGAIRRKWILGLWWRDLRHLRELNR